MVGVCSVSIPIGRAQQSKRTVPSAPIPTQILTAKKIFISNEGGETNVNLGDVGVYGAGPTDSYNQFYAAMKDWGKYEIVSAPADADLIFAIRFTVPVDWMGRGLGSKSADPQVRVVIFDPRTHVTLWVFTEHVESAMLQSNRNKNLVATVEKVVDDVKALVLPKS